MIKIINKDEVKSCYIHLPFCQHICSYCDFPKVIINDTLIEPYLVALENELLSYPIRSFKTIYIGGGTPSSLPNEYLEELLTFLDPFAENIEEYVIEANPESIDEAFVNSLAKHHINRVSIGVQSFDENILRLLNRHHNFDDVRRASILLTAAGITNYSFDFIYGIPTQNEEKIKNDIATALSLQPKHLSFYSLVIENNTWFKTNKVKAQDDDVLADTYSFIVSELKKNGFYRYEVSNFAEPTFESRHNLVYWENKKYLGIGMGASGYYDGIRYTNSLSIGNYINGTGIQSIEELSPADEEFNFLMLGLRLANGISLADYQIKFNKNFMSEYEERLKLIEGKYVARGGRFFIKEEYLYLLDHILLSLLKFKENN